MCVLEVMDVSVLCIVLCVGCALKHEPCFELYILCVLLVELFVELWAVYVL